ncbi:MAG TPA: hypothetical protein VGR35_06695 [Tepidisphaeraceae bacterium]|nr:hypothetical protein [Tepidisphaeraceae bacterium]
MSMSTSVATLLDRVLATWAQGLTPDSAEQVLRFQLDADTQRRIEQLADGAAQGTLTEADLEEYDEFVEAIDLIGILKAKARDALVRRAHAPVRHPGCSASRRTH